MVWPAPRNWARTKAGTADKGNLLRVDHCQGKIYRLRKSSQILRHICTNNLVTTCPKQPWPHLLLGSYGPQKMPQLPGSPPREKSLIFWQHISFSVVKSIPIFMKTLRGNMVWKTLTITPIPDENAFARRAPFEAGSPLCLHLSSY